MSGILKTLVFLEGVFLAWVLLLGFEADSAQTTNRHAGLGILAAMYTMFIHCLVLFYLVGSHRAIKQVVGSFAGLEAEYLPVIRRMKKQTFPLATFSIIAILIASFAGGWVHGEILGNRRFYPVFPVRAVPGWWLHLGLLVPALFLNTWAFWREIRVVGENVAVIRAINRRLAEGAFPSQPAAAQEPATGAPG